ncbi:peptidase family M20/M25/M40 [Hypoxylon argillaceum]|nr:peptidase family M20/M25/M40 [Hypoxylon argillaceum]
MTPLEKESSLPLTRLTPPRWRWVSAILIYTITFAAVLKISIESYQRLTQGEKGSSAAWRPKCPQVHPLVPEHQTSALSKMEEYIRSDKFRGETIDRMWGAIQIPTETYDDLGLVGEDPRWDIMANFTEYLKDTFPGVHNTLKLDTVNTYGLLFTWPGTESNLRPTLLMAHQDVVPVEEDTIDEWTYPPYKGDYDGKFIWGRGSSDDKNNLIGIMEAVELLLEADFQPRRSVVLAFGFDEEISGKQGARYMADALSDRYGDGGAAVIIDEGAGVAGFWGTAFGLPGVGEKGYADVEVIVQTPGGHSSVPPAHTSIGIAAELVTMIEANPYAPHFHAENPVLRFLECGSAHSPDFPRRLRKHLPWRPPSWPGQEDRLAIEAAKLGDPIKYLFTTSAAVDVIAGGVKVNALPERTRVLVNHRVNVGDGVAEVEDKLARLARKVAARHNLTIHAFDDDDDDGYDDPESIRLTTLYALEPAPVSPTSVDGVTPYSVLAGTTRALYGKSVIVAPAMMPGNTDSRHYRGLSKHIFRYNPGWDPEVGLGLDGIHTVNERLSLEAHTRAVEWYSLFIRNMDEAELDEEWH